MPAYGQRLLSEILCLQRDALSLFDRASSTHDIALVEQYLLGCGRIGYSGSEMFDAITLRETCITAVASQRPWEIRDNLEYIKNRAFLTNLMISRDYTQLNGAVKDIAHGTSDERMLHLEEMFAAKKVILDIKDTTREIQRNLKMKKPLLKDLLSALAKAAYIGLEHSDDLIIRCQEKLKSVSKSVNVLLHPICTALRDGHLFAADEGCQAAMRMGWTLSMFDANIIYKILEEKKRIAKQEEVKSRLVKIALSVKNGFAINTSELFQLLRMARLYKLYKDASLTGYFKTVKEHMSKFKGLLKQEETIKDMIEQKDLIGLKELLSGRGADTLS
jgi:hypothetical protein